MEIITETNDQQGIRTYCVGGFEFVVEDWMTEKQINNKVDESNKKNN